ncbi:MAG: hypothetical protein ACPLRX_01290 [Candidatus Saccharicenans sp.]
MDLQPEVKPDLEHKFTRQFMPFFLLICLAFSVFLYFYRNIPHGHRYDLVLKLTLEIFLVWLVYAYEPRWLGKKATVALVLAAGILLGVYQLKTINPDPEIIETYKSVFRDLEKGQNPYTSGQIYHRDENGQVVYHNFNYPPLELYPYWFFYKLVRSWSPGILTGLLIVLQLLAGLVLLLTFRNIKRIYILAFIPLLTFSEIKTNPAMTMLAVSFFIYLLYRQETRPSGLNRYLIAVVIGFGLLTKFFFVPLAAVYYLSRLDFKNLIRNVRVIGEMLISAGVAWLLMLPFGPWNIIKSTVLFNLNMSERNQVTTFYPNLLTSIMYLLGKPEFYPVIAVLALLLALALGARLRLFTAMLFVGTVFLLVSPTPEPQYFGTMLLLALGAKLWEAQEQATFRWLKEGNEDLKV